jgi:putative hemolysin
VPIAGPAQLAVLGSTPCFLELGAEHPMQDRLDTTLDRAAAPGQRPIGLFGSLLALVAALVVGLMPSKPADAGEQTRVANPAAVFCIDQGGDYLLDTGQCRLADGRLIDGWDYYRAEHESKAGLPNPAAVLCEEHGTYDLKNGTCMLKDGTVVDAWAFYRSQQAE